MTHVAQAATLKHFLGWDNVSAGQQRSCFCMVRNKLVWVHPYCIGMANSWGMWQQCKVVVSCVEKRQIELLSESRLQCASPVNTTVFSCLTLTKANSPSWKGSYQLCWCKHLWWCLVINWMIFHWIIWKLIIKMLLNRCFLYFCFKTWNQTRKQREMPLNECFCTSFIIFLFTWAGIKATWPLHKAAGKHFCLVSVWDWYWKGGSEACFEVPLI